MLAPPTVDASGLRVRLVRRRVGLVSACARLARQGFAARAGRLYGWSVAFGYGALLAHRAYSGDPDGSVLTLRLTLGTLSFAAGLVAWGTARDLRPEERATGLVMLAARLGFSPLEYRAARVVATMVVVGLAVALPGSLAAALGLGLSPSVPAARMGFLLIASVLVYAAAFGVVVGGLARWAAAVSPRHGRGLFAVVVLAPSVLDTRADLIAGFGWLIDRVAGLAGGAA